MKEAIFPGSFNPIHNGHVNIIKLAAKTYDTLYIYVANNENKEYAIKLANRYFVVKKIIDYLGLENVKVIKQNAQTPTAIFAKENNIQIVVRGNRGKHISDYEARIADDYLELNEKLRFHYITFENDANISSTLIRDLIQEGKSIHEFVPSIVEKDIKELWKEGN